MEKETVWKIKKVKPDVSKVMKQASKRRLETIRALAMKMIKSKQKDESFYICDLDSV